ncbi:MAG TPA: helical backbone metal receptor, partial [Vulgatibacter sp.]
MAAACFAIGLCLLGLPSLAGAQAPYRLGPEPAAKPARVVTLAPSLSEIVLELGAGDTLAGVSRYDDDPAVAALPRVGGYLDPSPEAILALRPDLLLVEPSPGNRAVVERLAGLGVSVLVLPLKGI